MKLGYFDCFAGAAGDMILACLFDVGLKTETLVEGLGKLGLRDVNIDVKDVVKKGVRAKAFGFRLTGAASDKGTRGTHREIVRMIETSALSASVKAGSLRAFEILAEAEARIHGAKKADVHFHEVGSLDSIVDVVGSFICIEALGLERVTSSPLALGMGAIRCEHGTLPSPAPATLEIAKGLPVRGWRAEGELTTPTGAAILKSCASDFGPIPDMTVTAVGYGAGAADLESVPNVMRLVVGEGSGAAAGPADLGRDRVVLLETNIDDINPQFFSHIYDDLFARGALDAWVENILMKKGRPGFLLSVLGARERAQALAEAIFSETTTSGVRIREVERLKLPRRTVEVQTKFGKIKVKVFQIQSRERCAPEYEDCLRVSRLLGVPVSDVMEEARRAFAEKGSHGE